MDARGRRLMPEADKGSLERVFGLEQDRGSGSGAGKRQYGIRSIGETNLIAGSYG